jgi:hypothetical protein
MTAAEVCWARWNAVARAQYRAPHLATVEAVDHPAPGSGSITIKSPTAIPTPCRGGVSEREVDAVLAGFVGWLAEGTLSPGQRRSCYRAVERFGSWRAAQRDRQPGPDHDLRRDDIECGRRRYLTVLRAAGHSYPELAVVDVAFEQLGCYLDPIPAARRAAPPTSYRAAACPPETPVVTDTYTS